jgi:hypothetical protein
MHSKLASGRYSGLFTTLGIEAAPLKPCGCNFATDLKTVIADDEYLQRQYRAKAAEFQQDTDDMIQLRGSLPPARAETHWETFLRWQKDVLIPKFIQRTGNRGIIIGRPDPNTPKSIDDRFLAAYKKSARRREIFDSAGAHERYHIRRSEQLRAQPEDVTALMVAKEEVEAYEAGLSVLRKALTTATCTKCQRCVSGKCTNRDALGKEWDPEPFAARQAPVA